MIGKPNQLRVVTLAGVFISVCTASIALGEGNQNLPGKEPVVYEKYSCKLMLPGEGWRWFEAPELEAGKAFIVHDSRANVVLIIRPTEQTQLSDGYVRGLERGFLKATGGKKLGSRKITYKGLACYEFTAFVSVTNEEATARMFVAEGFLYSLTVSVPPEATNLVSVSDIFDKCFEFTGTISSEWLYDVDAEYEAALEAIDRRVLWGCLPVLVVGVGILILIRRKRKKSSQQSAPPDPADR